MLKTRFSELELSPALRRGVADAGFVEPRPIQVRTIPEALSGRDILGLAQTGTGKTAAFALPLLERVLASRARRGDGPLALVVAPTRELAGQIAEEIRLLARHTRVKVATVFGGVSLGSQRNALSQRPEIVVACPGRLLDLWGQGAVRLDRVEALVLDEADHMFDMGFLPDVRRILAALPSERQNMLFSATMPTEIRRLADRLLRDPHVVQIDHAKPLDTIEHAFFPVDGPRKFELLQRVLAEDGFVSAIVFTRTKHRAKRLARQLDGSGHRAVALQGNMSQNARQRAMDGFRERRFDVLVATDIAARGIDVEQVSHVVNFDMPTTPEAYTHRIGRTGRSERNGRAYTFITLDDGDLVRAVERRMGAAIPRRKIDGFASVSERAEAGPERRASSSRRRGPGRGAPSPARSDGRSAAPRPSSTPRKRRRRGARRGTNTAMNAGTVRANALE